LVLTESELQDLQYLESGEGPVKRAKRLPANVFLGTLLLVNLPDQGPTLAILESGISGRAKVGVRPLAVHSEGSDHTVYTAVEGNAVQILWEEVIRVRIDHTTEDNFYVVKNGAARP
jgi:hypothetical protein